MSETVHVVCPHCDAVNRLPASRVADRPNCGGCKKGLFMGEPLALTESNFQQHIVNSELPILVDFWAPWCGPCQSMAPAFASAAKQLEPRLRLAKVDTEAHQQLSARYGIRSIPTLILFKDGKELARQPGAMGESDIVRWVGSHLTP